MKLVLVRLSKPVLESQLSALNRFFVVFSALFFCLVLFWIPVLGQLRGHSVAARGP